MKAWRLGRKRLKKDISGNKMDKYRRERIKAF